MQGHRAPAAEYRSERAAGRERPAGEGVQEESSRPRREPAPLRRHTPARRSASAQGARAATSPGVQREPDAQGAARRSLAEREPVRARTSQLPAIRRGGRGSHLPPQLRPLAHRDEPMLFDIQPETPQAPSASAQATQPADSAVSSAPVTAAPTQSAPSQSDSAEAAQPTAPVPTQPPAAPARPEAAAKTGRVPQQNPSGASSFERSGSFDADVTAPITDGISTANLAQRAAAARAQATRAAEAAQQVQREAAERARRRARQLNLQNPYPQQDPVQQPSSDTAEHTTVPLGQGATPDAPPVQPPVPHTPVPSTIDESDLDSLDDDVSPVFEPQQQLGTLGSGFEDTSTQGIRLGPGAMPMFKATSNTWEPVELPKPLHTLHQKKDKDAKGKGKTGE